MSNQLNSVTHFWWIKKVFLWKVPKIKITRGEFVHKTTHSRRITIFLTEKIAVFKWTFRTHSVLNKWVSCCMCLNCFHIIIKSICMCIPIQNNQTKPNKNQIKSSQNFTEIKLWLKRGFACVNSAFGVINFSFHLNIVFVFLLRVLSYSSWQICCFLLISSMFIFRIACKLPTHSIGFAVNV